VAMVFWYLLRHRLRLDAGVLAQQAAPARA
jgi:hypothetical protein